MVSPSPRNCGHNRISFPSSCSPHAAVRRTYSTDSARAPTIICPNRSIFPSCWRASTDFSAAWLGFARFPPPEPAQPPPEPGPPPASTSAGRTIHFPSLQLTTPDKTIRLTLMECDLLRYLVLNQGRIISRKELLEQVWRVHEDTDTRAIDNFMVRLRRYIEDNPADPVFLETVRGIGYRFLPRVPADSSGEREEKPK